MNLFRTGIPCVVVALLFAEQQVARAASTCLSIAGGTSPVSLGTTLTFTASCCSAVPALANQGWFLGGLLLIVGVLATRKNRQILSGALMCLLFGSFARPAQGQSCGASLLWSAQSASEAFGGSATSFSFTPTHAGTFTVSLRDASETATPVTVQVVDPSCSTTHLVISEVRSRGLAGAADEFVELYNPTTSPVTLDSSWRVEARSNTSQTYTSRWVGTGKVIPAQGHFLIAGTAYTDVPAADEALSTGITDATSVRLVQGSLPQGNLVDAVCYAFDAVSAASFDTTYSCEGTPIAYNPHNNATSTNTDASIERRPGGAEGNCTDIGDNASDFLVSTPANPQDSASALTP